MTVSFVELTETGNVNVLSIFKHWFGRHIYSRLLKAFRAHDG
jgi:hypothetical protein